MLQERGKGRNCPRHKSRPSRLGVLWADGRAMWFPCGVACFEAWRRENDKKWPKTEVVMVVDLLGGSVEDKSCQSSTMQ